MDNVGMDVASLDKIITIECRRPHDLRYHNIAIQLQPEANQSHRHLQ